MLDFTFCSPTKFVFGKNAQQQTAALVKEFGGTRVLLHYGGGSVKRSGLLDEVKALLEKEGLYTVELGGAQPNPLSGLVFEGIELVQREKLNFILPVGGGSAIDSAKAIATGACYDGDFWDFFSGKAAPAKALPLGVVLTIPAAGSESSNSMVITNEKNHLKRGHNAEIIRPLFAVMNPELTYTLPSFQTACGVSDMMMHIFERYFTNTPDVDLTDRLCESVLQSVLYAGPTAIAQPEHYEARATLMWAGTLAHNNLLGVGRQQDWASHGISHELSALYGSAHGAALAVVFPAWMEYTLSHNPLRFAQLAVRVFGCEMHFEHPEDTAREGIACLKRFWKSIGLPGNLAELGAKTEDIPKMAETVNYGPNGTLGAFLPLSKADVIKVLELAAK